MRLELCAAILLFAVPSLASDAKLEPPSSPPPVTYAVWGFRWDGRQFERQPKYTFTTSDLAQAADYAATVTSYAGWSATTNMPAACVVHTVFHGPILSNTPPAVFPDKPTYAIWAFKLTDGKWIKDEPHSWTTDDPVKGGDYVKKVNAVRGWCATSNCPEPVPAARRSIDGGLVHSAEQYRNCRFDVCETWYGPAVSTGRRPMVINWMGWNINVDIPIHGGDGGSSYSDPSFDTFSYDTSTSITPAYDNSNDIQNMLNTQNMINTQNMVNNIQDMVNTQNMIDTQNMINSMQANP
jgi:hypothetical protein